MADTTISFKIDPETYQKYQTAKDEYQGTQKEWIAKALTLMETQRMKTGSPEFVQELSELEVHTNRIYELTTNMVQRSVHMREHAVHDLEIKLENQRDITSSFQFRIKEVEVERDDSLKQLELSKAAELELQKQLEDSHEQLNTNKLLISEYKEKNDTLNGLVTKYQGYAEENEQIKDTLNKERQDFEQKKADFTRQASEQELRIVALEQQLQQREETHQIAIERLNDQRDLQQERVLLKADREHQSELTKISEQYNQQLQSIYEQLRDERKASLETDKTE